MAKNKAISLVLITLLTLVAGCSVNETDDKALCETSGGEQLEFSNSCADSCELERNAAATSCALATTVGCDCGPDMCWNGRVCENN